MGETKSVSRKLIDYSLNLKYEDLPAEVVHMAKQVLIDAIGNAFGGFGSDASEIMRKVVNTLKMSGEATIIGSGEKVSPHYAAWINGVMIRYLDFNDCYIRRTGTSRGGGHPSDLISAVLALGEQAHVDGRELITSIVLGYELSARLATAVQKLPPESRGWNSDYRANYMVPILAGRIMGLTPEQIQNAVGIAGSRDLILNILDATGEEYTMAKNMRFSYASHNSILFAMLAKEGFTGPERVFEGDSGLIQTVFGGDYDLDDLLGSEDMFRIMDTGFKSIPADRSIQGHVLATLTLAREHDLKPEDVASVLVQAGARAVTHTTDPSKKYPTNAESADHSSFWLTACAIAKHDVGPRQFNDENYYDPVIKALIERTEIKIDNSFDAGIFGGSSTITTVDGKTYTCRIDDPKGNVENRMTDEEITAKYADMASLHLPEERVAAIAKMVYDVENLADIGDLMKLLVF